VEGQGLKRRLENKGKRAQTLPGGIGVGTKRQTNLGEERGKLDKEGGQEGGASAEKKNNRRR